VFQFLSQQPYNKNAKRAVLKFLQCRIKNKRCNAVGCKVGFTAQGIGLQNDVLVSVRAILLRYLHFS
jgi:hypothetical protein